MSILVNDTVQASPTYIVKEDEDALTYIIAGYSIPMTIKLPAGRYFAGDLCYALPKDESRQYKLFIKTLLSKKWRNYAVCDGRLAGRELVYISLHADGCAVDESEYEYGIETASFCVMRLRVGEHHPVPRIARAMIGKDKPEVCGREYEFDNDVTVEVTKQEIDDGITQYTLVVCDGLTQKTFRMWP
jgi:hypothetical protein